MKLQSVGLSVSTNSIKLLHSTAKLVQCHDSEYYISPGSNNDDNPILVYCFNLPPNSANSQWHLAVSRLEQKLL